MELIIDVLRHAAAPAIDGQLDNIHRYLSVDGIKQALQLRRNIKHERIGEDGRVKAAAILYSPALRSLTTAAIAYSVVPNVSLIELPELFTPGGEDGEILDEAFKKEGKNYGYDFTKWRNDRIVWKALLRLGAMATAKIVGSLDEVEALPYLGAPPNSTSPVIVVATHAIYSNVIAYCFAQTPEAAELCFGINMGEGDRLRVKLDGLKCEGIEYLPLAT